MLDFFKKYHLWLIFLIIGLFSTSLNVWNYYDDKAIMEGLDFRHLCLLQALFLTFNVVPYLLVYVIPYFRNHGAPATSNEISMVLFSIVSFLFYLLLAFVLNKIKAKSNKLFWTVLIVLIIACVLGFLFYLYISCFFLRDWPVMSEL